MRVDGLAWKVPGGSGYVNVPDIAVVSPGFARVGALHLEPPPLLVIEVASPTPSTREVDRGRKLADYRLGGARLYVLVDLPALSKVMAVSFESHDFVAEQLRTANNVIELTIDDRPLRLDLSSLAGKGLPDRSAGRLSPKLGVPLIPAPPRPATVGPEPAGKPSSWPTEHAVPKADPLAGQRRAPARDGRICACFQAVTSPRPGCCRTRSRWD